MDDGAFRDASGTHNMTGFTPVTFSTVKPGTHSSGGTVASEAVASQTMSDAGVLGAGKSWMDIEGIGNNTGSVEQLGSLSNKSFALVMKNYSTTPGQIFTGGGGFNGLALHDTDVGIQNFGSDDILYFDAQTNDPLKQLFLANYVKMTPGGSTHPTQGLDGQTALLLGLVSSPTQKGSSAVVDMGFEGNTSNTYFSSVYVVDGVNGFANFLRSDPLIMG
jgi:hypothetical protein